MGSIDLSNKAAAGVPFYTPAQEPPAGSAEDESSTPTLFRPLRIRSLNLHNRVVVSPMCQYSAHDGHLTDYHLVHLGQYALNGAGLVIIEATAVEPRGRISPQDSGLWTDSQIDPLRRIAQFAHSQGTKAGIQITHSGRKASTLAPWIGGSAKKTIAEREQGGWPDDIVAPSPIPFSPDHAAPNELSEAEIRDIVKAFSETAARAVKAGLDMIELHGAHGYLISSFLSPLSNKRKDKYGGSFENRIRFLHEVVDAVRSAIPETIPLWVRISATEWMEWSGQPSWDLESSIRLAKLLPAWGVDVLDVSSGGSNSQQKIKQSPTFQTDLARQIREVVRAEGLDLIIAAVGAIENADFAHAVVEDGPGVSADLALIGKQFLRQPELTLSMARQLKVPVKWPNQYHRAELR